MSGVSAGGLEGKRWGDLAPTELRADRRAFLDELERAGGGSQHGQPYRRADGPL